MRKNILALNVLSRDAFLKALHPSGHLLNVLKDKLIVLLKNPFVKILDSHDYIDLHLYIMPTSKNFSASKIFNQKGSIQFILPILLLVGIAAGVFLITSGNPLKLFSRAGNPPIVAKTLTGLPLTPDSNSVVQITNPAIKLELTSPLGPARAATQSAVASASASPR